MNFAGGRRPSPRLAFFIQDLRGGGAERAVVRVVNGLIAQDTPVDLVLVRRTGAFLEELDPRVNLIVIGSRRTASAAFALRAYLKRTRPDVLFSTMTHANITAILANAFPSKLTRLVVIEHNQYTRNIAGTSGLTRIAYRLVGTLYPLADAVAGVTEGLLDDLFDATGAVPRRRVVLPNPVITPKFRDLANEEVSHPWFDQPGPPVVLAVGRLATQKNYPLLIRAFRDLRRRRDARLLILGEGDLRAELQALVNECEMIDDVVFLGFRPNPLPYMRKAAVFVLSSDWEGLPTVVIEALGTGCPVVSTDCPTGPREILEGGRYGRLVPVNQPTALADAIDAALGETDGRETRQRRANDFDTAHAVEKYLGLAADLVGETSSIPG